MTKVFGVFIDNDYRIQLGKLFHEREDAEACLEAVNRVCQEYRLLEEKEDYEYCNEYYNGLDDLEQMAIGADDVFVEEVEIE